MLPIGGRIAEAHASRLFAIVTGFAQSQMLAAALELGCFDRMTAGPVAAGSLVDLPQESAQALVAAMIALGLWEARGDGRIGLTVDGLVVATDLGIRAMIAHHRLLYADLADPVAALRRPGSGQVAAFWPYARGDGASAAYSALMAASHGFVTAALLGGYDFARHDRVMDVGGGDGGVVLALAARYPRLALTLVDLPPVAALAATRIAAADGGDRIAVAGCAPDAPLPTGADAVTLVRLLHDLDDDAVRLLLRRVADALPEGGTVIVAEPMRGAGRDSVAAYFAAYFVAMGSGRLRSFREIRALLQESGLKPVGRHRRGFLLDILVARRASK